VTYRVRLATVDDATAIGEAHAEAWSVAYRSLFDAAFLMEAVNERRHRWSVVMSTDGHVTGHLLVAEHVEHGVVGFAHSARLPDTDEGEVFGFYVHPDHWGTAAAQAMMQASLAALRRDGCQRARLWTHARATRAQGFYEKVGWSRSGATKHEDFGDGLPAPLVEYRTDLKPAPAEPHGSTAP
jgi:GNAT superfamily N-acetyltransferase